MKKSVTVLLGLLAVILTAGFTSAACSLDITLLNQDPYPAQPGEIVEVVFQLSGISDPTCGVVTMEVIENFPFTLESGDGKITVRSGTYTRGYKSELVVPYNLIVDERAVDGNNEIEVRYYTEGVGDRLVYTDKFNINVDNVLTDFEVSVKDYDYTTNTITFEILNIGENDVEALTIDVPQQENLEIKGSNRNIVGSLDASEDTTFSFEATPHNGEIELQILYTDETNVRRSLTKRVTYDSINFENRKADEKSPISGWFYITIILIAIILFSWYRERRRRKKKKEEYRRMHGSSHEHHEGHHHKKR